MKTKLLVIISILSGLFVTVNKSYGWTWPTAVLIAEPNYIIADRNATLDGSGSYPDIVEYKWDFTNDGSYDYTETSNSHPDGAFDGITTHKYISVSRQQKWHRLTPLVRGNNFTFGNRRKEN